MAGADAREAQLAAVRQRILDDGVTPDLASQATQLVFADGSADAELVFIGEAPGKSEDQQGIPFVGASGRFLEEMLATIGFKRSQVYITNIVKYRPPDNRDPTPEEKKAFLPHLQAQLEIIKPKVVITLGRHSMNCFLPDLQISKVHGQPKRIRIAFNPDSEPEPVVIMPLFHPAAALYNGAMRQTLLDDFAGIPAVIKQL